MARNGEILKGTSDGTWHYGCGGMERQTGNFQVSALSGRVTEKAGLKDSDVSEPVTGFKLS